MYLWINELFYYLSNITSLSCKHPDMHNVIKSSHLWEFVDFQSYKNHSFKQSCSFYLCDYSFVKEWDRIYDLAAC